MMHDEKKFHIILRKNKLDHLMRETNKQINKFITIMFAPQKSD